MTEIQFAGLGLAEPLLRAVTDAGYAQHVELIQRIDGRASPQKSRVCRACSPLRFRALLADSRR